MSAGMSQYICAQAVMKARQQQEDRSAVPSAAAEPDDLLQAGAGAGVILKANVQVIVAGP